MDGDYRFDLEEICCNIDVAEVISIFFPLLRKTFLMDTRSDIEDGPLIKVVPMVDSVEERFRALRRLRPRLPRPESITVIPWPKHVRTLRNLGIWDRLMQRAIDTSCKDAEKRCEDCYTSLVDLDNAELASVINGDNYYTLWDSSR